jgi:hypothetical protein
MSLRLITFGVEIIAGGCTSRTDRANRFRVRFNKYVELIDEPVSER